MAHRMVPIRTEVNILQNYRLKTNIFFSETRKINCTLHWYFQHISENFWGCRIFQLWQKTRSSGFLSKNVQVQRADAVIKIEMRLWLFIEGSQVLFARSGGSYFHKIKYCCTLHILFGTLYVAATFHKCRFCVYSIYIHIYEYTDIIRVC